MRGTTPEMLQSHLDYYCWKVAHENDDMFLSFLRDIRTGNMNGSSNENIYPAERDRKRIIFTSAEKAYVVNLVMKHHDIIQCKKNDTVTLYEKAKAWEEVGRIFNAVPHHTKRTSKQLKKLWENINQIMRKKNNHEGGGDSVTPVQFKDEASSEHTLRGEIFSNEYKTSNSIEDTLSSEANDPQQMAESDILQSTQSEFTEMPVNDRIRFTENEKVFLYKQVAMCHDILDSRKCDVYTSAEKNRIWDLITRTYNSVPCHTKRSHVQIKKWWENTKARRKQDNSRIDGEEENMLMFKEEPTDFLFTLNGHSNGTEDSDGGAMSQTEEIDEDHDKLATQCDEPLNVIESNNSGMKKSKRFTLSEKAFLAEVIMTKYNDIIGDSSSMDNVSSEQKNEAWEKVASAFNAVPHHSKRTRTQLIKLWRAMIHSRIKRGESVSTESSTALRQEDAAEFLLRLGLINYPYEDSNEEVIEPNHQDLPEVEIDPSSTYDHPSFATRKRLAERDKRDYTQHFRTQQDGDTRVDHNRFNIDNEKEIHLLVVEEMKQRVALARLKVKAEEEEQKRAADAHTLEMAFKKQKWDLELKILRKNLNEV